MYVSGWGERKFFCPLPVIDDAAISKLAEELEVFYTYAVCTPRNNNVYIGLSRQHPYTKFSAMAERVRSAPEFRGFWGCYDLLILNSNLNRARAVEAEKSIIRKIRESERYSAINKSAGGTVGFPLKKAISNAARKKYYSYLTEEIIEQKFWSFRLWEMDPRPEWSCEEQLPKPSKRFRTMAECIEDVAQELTAAHLEYVASNRKSSFFREETLLLDFLDCT